MLTNDIHADYSLLIATQEIASDQVRGFLADGLKLVLFVGDESRSRLGSEFHPFVEAGFLNLYANPKHAECVIPDGKSLDKSILERLEAGDDRFNLEQYEIEHGDITHNMIVVAGAGTGKTHVMINRILFLMHMDKEFDFSKVAMITFTNKATDNMRHRLIRTLEAKYRLTRKFTYLERIEELSRINISTIHSFFKKVIVEVGVTLGYGTNIQLRSFIKEKKELLRDLLDRRYKGKSRIEETIGLTVHDIETLAMGYWDKLDNIGLSEGDIQKLDWMGTSSETARKIQDTLKDIFSKVDDEYNQIKYINNAISMKDIIHELNRVIDRPELKDYISHKYRYMFCDEFQDSDNVQIRTIAILNRLYDGRLFVVGDIKQSIYRFRGATDSAFAKLKALLNDEERARLTIKSLTKNYRTSKTVLDRLDRIFTLWGPSGFNLLQYEDGLDRQDRLIPQNKEPGVYRQIPVQRKSRAATVMRLVKEVQETSGHKRITFLTRTNKHLADIKDWCEKEKRVCLIRERGAFFRSPAVLDFCALIEALFFDNEPMYLYGYVLSSYGTGTVDFDRLAQCDGDKSKIMAAVSGAIDRERWDGYRKDLQEKPVMAVLRGIIAELEPARNYGTRRKAELISKRYPPDRAAQQAVVDCAQYEADLKKLLQLLTDQFSRDFTSLGDLCGYVRLKIMTDSNEEVAEAEQVQGIDYIEGMTVHGAKGLEFENVFIPFMNNKFYQDFRPEILVDGESGSVGWVYRGKNIDEIKNDRYDRLIGEEMQEIRREETRLLYVAMTRAVHGLYCFPERSQPIGGGIGSWADLLPKENDDAGNH